MGAESTTSYRPRTPSRLSNCGEMVAESVLEQLEEELMLEDARSTLTESRMQSPTTGRTLLVGMKLNATCREMLAWTIVDLAKPGDHIVAFHVSSFPLQSGMASTPQLATFSANFSDTRSPHSVQDWTRPHRSLRASFRAPRNRTICGNIFRIRNMDLGDAFY